MSDEEARAIVEWFMQMVKSYGWSTYEEIIEGLLLHPCEPGGALPEPFCRAVNEYVEAHK